MAKLKIPTVQHLVRHWNPNPDLICKSLVRLAVNPPTFNYDLIYRLTRDMLLMRVPYEDAIKAINRVKRGDLRENYLEIMPLLRDHFENENPDYFQDIAPRFYSVGRGLMIPFAPPFLYGVGGQIIFPWISLWRSNPLADEPLFLFVTVVEEIMLQDPDLEEAHFQIIDLSASKKTRGATEPSKRQLRVVDARDIPRVSDSRKRDMLEISADGYFRAQAILAAMPPPPPKGDTPPGPNPNQDDLFDEDEKEP